MLALAEKVDPDGPDVAALREIAAGVEEAKRDAAAELRARAARAVARAEALRDLGDVSSVGWVQPTIRRDAMGIWWVSPTLRLLRPVPGGEVEMEVSPEALAAPVQKRRWWGFWRRR